MFSNVIQYALISKLITNSQTYFLKTHIKTHLINPLITVISLSTCVYERYSKCIYTSKEENKQLVISKLNWDKYKLISYLICNKFSKLQIIFG